MDGDLKYIHVVWIPAIPAGMTRFLIYHQEKHKTLCLLYDYEAQYLPPLNENFYVILKNQNRQDPAHNAKVCHITY